MILVRNNTQNSGGEVGRPVPSRLSLHQDEFDIVLNYRVWFVRLPQKAGAILNFISCIGDFVPDDRGKIVKAHHATVLLNRRMQVYNGVAAVILPSGKAHIADHANQATTGNQGAKAMLPYLVKLTEEIVVVFDVSHLPSGIAVLFEGPIWRRGEDEMNRVRGELGHFTRIAVDEPMRGRNLLYRLFDDLN